MAGIVGSGRPRAAIAAVLAAGGAALAQIPGGQARLPPLPGAPWHERWIFEQPWLLAVGLAVGALVAATLLRRLGRPGGRAVLLVGLLLGGAVAAAGLLVTTTRERVALAAKDLVRAVAENDQPALGRRLHELARLRLRALGGAPVGRQAILDGVDRLARSFPPRSARVLEVRTAIYDGGAARSQVRVRVDADQIPPYSWWQLDWQREGEEWKLTAVEPLWILGIDTPAG